MLNVTALSFNGINQRAKLSSLATIKDMDSFTRVYWIKCGEKNLTQDQGRFHVELQGTYNKIRYAASAYKDKLRFELAVKDGETATKYDYTTKWDDYWHLVGFVARLSGDKPTYDIIYDGVVVSSGTLVVPKVAPPEGETLKISNTTPKGIFLGNYNLTGGSTFSNSTYWHGKIDEVMLFNEAKSQSALADYYSANAHWDHELEEGEDPDESLISSYRFDENQGTTFSDYVTNTSDWRGTLYENNAVSSNLWTIDRPFLGEGNLDTTAPTVPTSNATTDITATSFKASWNASTDNVYVQFYELQVSEFSNFVSYSAYEMGVVRTETVKNLVPATNYYWRVRAFDAQLNASAYSAVRSLTTLTSGDVTPPNPPTNVAATFITHSSARITFTQSSSVDAIGYKLDISLSSDFNGFFSEWTSRDIGNVSFIDVFDLEPLTTHYVRLRAYDSYANESPNSVVYQLNTLRRPDTTPPLPVTALMATGVSSRAATLHCTEGIDDTGVVGYRLDISTSPIFETYVQTEDEYYNDADLGNNRDPFVSGLTPDTTYFYRFRAYDDAGNISDNDEEPNSFQTDPPSIYEGDLVRSSAFLEEGKLVKSDTPTVLYPMSNEILVGGGYESWFEIRLADVVGTIESGMLRLYVIGSTFNKVLKYQVDAMPMPSTFTNYNTRPTLESVEGEITINQVNDWVDIDITSLLSEGTTEYTVRLYSAETTPIRFYSSQGEIVLKAATNYIQNPSGGANTNLWLAEGTGTGHTVSRSINDPFPTAIQGTFAAGSGAGQWYLWPNHSSITLPLAAGAKTFIGSMKLIHHHTTSIGLSVTIRVEYTDFTTVDSGTIGNTIAPNTVVRLSTPPVTTNAAKTVKSVTIFSAITTTIGASNLIVKATEAQVEEGTVVTDPIPQFNGDGSLKAGYAWVGTPHNSTSTRAEMRSDDPPDNPAIVEIESDPLTSTQPIQIVVDRQGSGLRENLVINPSFETNTTGWTSVGSSSLLQVSSAFATSGSSYLQVSGTKVVGVDSGVILGPLNTHRPAVEANATYTVALDLVHIPTPTDGEFELRVIGADASGNLLSPIATTNIKARQNRWAKYSLTFTVPTSGVPRVAFAVYRVTAGAYIFAIDSVILEKAPYAGGYFSGDSPDSLWIGTANASISTRATYGFKATSYFVGDANENNSVKVRYKHALDNTWGAYTINNAVVNRTLKTATIEVPSSIGNYNMVRNPSFETDTTGWSGTLTITDVDSVSGTYCALSTDAAFLQAFFIQKAGTYTFSVYVKAAAECKTFIDMYNYTTNANPVSPTIYHDGQFWKRHTITFTTLEDNTRVDFSIMAQTAANVMTSKYIDAAQLERGSVATEYKDGYSRGAYWEGSANESTTAFEFTPNEEFNIMFEYQDDDGFFDQTDVTTYEQTEVFLSPTPPDNALTILPLELSATADSITIRAPYQGDDDNNSTARIEFRRVDLPTWSEARPTYYRSEKFVGTTVSGMKGGTSYIVRVTFSDPSGVFGYFGGIVSGEVSTTWGESLGVGESHISFGGFVLMGRSDGKIGVNAHDGFGFPERRLQIEDLPRRHGAMEIEALWGKRVIQMDGFISANNREELAAMRDELANALSPNLQRLIIDTLASNGRFYYATVSMLDISELPENINHLKWRAEFTCADPFAYNMSESSVPLFTTPNGGQLSINNDGSEEIYPTIFVSTPSPSPVTFSIYNQQTGERLSPKTTIVSGDKITIDSERKRLQKNGVEVDYSGAFPSLIRGSNKLFFNMTSNGTPTLTLELRWRTKFL